ncbi:MAG: sulfite exporter TauE/SafE family protein [Phenylobacterium sp.]|uniref:sulfite exporter TauE/SafE family protein n=1 Tax=Phenylobacterium sp. TaxID=1871053 RepID=UPI002723A375|nr:sulfite exporter TauE/SafE family protein [Phenylobacterium sp.]MDO8901427.1 sulfite exporter TauE/SafE family protein [Phenylobacterium sp.]
MTLPIAIFILASAFATAALSGVFGMAGGLVLMGALALVLPVSAAFVTHGILQLVANGWRAILHRRHVRWDIVGWYALASLIAGVLVSLAAFTPSKPFLFLMLGLVPWLTWLPTGWLRLDAARPPQAFASGFLVTGLNLMAGVAGPLLDIFFVRTELTRHAIVATKAATQVFAHLAKIVVYGAPLMVGAGRAEMPPWWLFALAIPLSMAGTWCGGLILERVSDVNFKRWTRWIVTAVGVLYLIQAAQLLAGGA